MEIYWARVLELADSLDLKSSERKLVWVRIPPRALWKSQSAKCKSQKFKSKVKNKQFQIIPKSKLSLLPHIFPNRRMSAKRIEDPLGLLRDLGGYYSCPKDKKGRRLGPLVGYAEKYLASDGSQKQWVGDDYVNFAMAEENSLVLRDLAVEMKRLLQQPNLRIGNFDTFCGAPLGGYSFATILGLVCEKRVIKAEKKVTALATATSREQSEIVFARHEIHPGEKIAIVEDLCNNFSTTNQLIDLIRSLGGDVVVIVCFLNRSLVIDSSFKEIPVINIVRKQIPEYHQDDPAVRDDIAKGNVVLKPKNEWPRLMAAMEKGA